MFYRDIDGFCVFYVYAYHLKSQIKACIFFLFAEKVFI